MEEENNINEMPSQQEEASPAKRNNNVPEFHRFTLESESSSPTSNNACMFLFNTVPF